MMERPFWQRVLIQVWPTIRKVINDILFLFEKIIKSFIKTLLGQV
jgi:hypothetical protein